MTWSPHVPQPGRKYCEQFEVYWERWILDPENKRRAFEIWMAALPREEFIDDDKTDLGRELSKDSKENDQNTEWTR